MSRTTQANIALLCALALAACEHVVPRDIMPAGKGDTSAQPAPAAALDPSRITADIAALASSPSRHALRWDPVWLRRLVPDAPAAAGVAQLVERVFGERLDPLDPLRARLQEIAADRPLAQAWEHRFGFRNIVGYGPAFDANGDPSARSPATNLVLELAGDDPASGALIVGAHYDTIAAPGAGWTQALVRDVVAAQPGADDNAAGVAAVLELARVIAARRDRDELNGVVPARRPTIYFVLFGAEEVGRQGSYAFARLCPGGDRSALNGSVVADRPGAALAAFCEARAGRSPFLGMINLDSLGYAVAQGVAAPDHARIFRDPGDASSVALAARVLDVVEERAPAFTLVDTRSADRLNKYGDHLSFSEIGLAAVRIMAVGDSPHHHSATDTLENLDPEYVARIAGVVLDVIETLAGEG